MEQDMKNTDKAAMPQTPMFIKHGTAYYGDRAGLTKREYFAGLTMKGFISNPNCRGSFQEIAKDAVLAADALLAALDEQ